MQYKVKLIWEKTAGDDFLKKNYSRVHKWIFDGGIELKASSSPHVVPVPMSDESAVDPEEAFIAAISSCHMLSFLFVAAKEKFIIESYKDNAVGIMKKNDDGKLAITEVTLNPKIIFGGNKIPDQSQLNDLHHRAHEECFIASSVKTKIHIAECEISSVN